jgi:FtsZ-binding cell division protein ZapB
MREEMANLTREVHELRGTVSGLEREREQLLDALARWQPPSGGAGE